MEAADAPATAPARDGESDSDTDSEWWDRVSDRPMTAERKRATMLLFDYLERGREAVERERKAKAEAEENGVKRAKSE